MRILAVDDEPYILELLPLLAAKAGFPDVTTVASGDGALEALEVVEIPFDCFVLDISMPGMDGTELCGRIRKFDAYRTSPVIMLTAMSEHQFMDAAFRAGATDYATKPFDIRELGTRLRVAQELVAARREAQEAKSARLLTATANISTKSFDHSDAFAILGVGDFVEMGSLKNYLKQSSRAGLAASQLIAIKIDAFDQISGRASADEYRYALHEVAHAVNETFRATGCLMSHAGDGMFLVVSKAASPLLASEVESHVQHLLDERHLAYDSGSPMDIAVSVGSPILPSFGDLSDIASSVDRAMARADVRSVTKNDQARVLSFRRF